MAVPAYRGVRMFIRESTVNTSENCKRPPVCSPIACTLYESDCSTAYTSSAYL